MATKKTPPAHDDYREQKNVTKKGTEKSTRKPWNSEIKTNLSPLHRVMMGSVVSMVVAPPAEMGANGPKNLTRSGAPSNVKISRMILASRATVPNSGPRYSVMRMLDNE